MRQLRFIISLCLSISLVLGQLSSINCTYASPLVRENENFTLRQRKGGNSSAASDAQQDIENANYKYLKKQLRQENQKKLDTSNRYGMVGLIFLATYMILWNIAHTPKALSASRPYDPQDYKNFYNQQRSFTNSGAFSALQCIFLFVAVGAMIKSVYNFWQVRDSLPSAKEVKQKAKEGGVNTVGKSLYAISQLLKIVPASWRTLKAKREQEVMPVIFRPKHGSTQGFDYHFTWKDKLLPATLVLFGGLEASIVRRVFKPISPEFKGYLQNPPQAFNAKKLILDLSEFKFCDQDFSYWITFNNLVELRLKGSNLTDGHLDLLRLFGGLIEVLDIRDNEHIKVEQLKTFVLEATGPQFVRGAGCFESLRTLILDGREDLICEEGIFSGIRSFAIRKVRVKGELSRKEELRQLFDRQFHYFNQVNLDSSFPSALGEIIGENPKRSLQNSYIVKGYRDRPEIEYKQDKLQLDTIREVMNAIHRLALKGVSYLIEYDEKNKPITYMASKSLPQARGSLKEKYYHVTEERMFAEILSDCKTFEERIEGLEKDLKSYNSSGAYLINFDSNGHQTIYSSHSVFQYHSKKDVWFTPSTIYLPSELKGLHDLMLYLRARHRIYIRANPDKLGSNEVKDISPFVKVDLQDGFVVLADELKAWVNPVNYPFKKLEKLGLLTESRLIETLARCGFLKYLKLDNLN